MKITMPARREGKTVAGLKLVGMFIAANKPIAIGTSNPDKLHDQIKELYPDAKLSKHRDYVQVEAK